MRIDRGLLGWGVFLVVLGAIPLAVSQGVLPKDIRWWELWPLILVGIGLAIILRRSPFAPLGGLLVAASFGAIVGGALAAGSLPMVGAGCIGGSGTAFETQSGSLPGSSANVSLEMGCGDVNVTTANGTDWRIAGTSEGGRVPSIDASGSSVSARIATSGGFFGARSRWDVSLPSGPRLELSVTENAGTARLGLGGANLERLDLTMNAGDGRVDLTGTTPTSLNVTVNAGSTRIQLPAASMTGGLTVNAGSISLCRAPGVALRLETNDNITAGYDYGSRGLVKNGNVWTTPDWATATTRIDLSTSANAGSFSLDPQEGCK